MKGNWGGAEWSVPQRVVQQRLERSGAGSPAECSRPQRVVQRAGLAGGEWLLVASSPAACAVCVADVLACDAAARCAPLYPSAPATLPLRSRLARAPREHTAVRGRTRGVNGGAGGPTERGEVTKNILDIYNIKRRYFFDGICMGFVGRAWPAWPMEWDGIGMGFSWDKKSHPTHHGQSGEKICINTIVMKKVHFMLPLSLISGGSSSGM